MNSSPGTSPNSSASSETPVGSYPEPLVEGPVSGEHKETFIILHGRGDKGDHFGPQLLTWPIMEHGNLQVAFPNAKFIFPTASKRRAKVLNNTAFNQWFDIRSLVDPEEDPDLQYEGLRESTEYVCGLLRSAVEEVGPDNVVLWGLSQGCAIMLMTLLHWEGEPFAGAVGMCGWLPLRKRMLEAAVPGPADSVTTDNPFEGPSEDHSSRKSLDRAVSCLREVLGLDSGLDGAEHICLRIPVFLGHGVRDEKVAVDLGRYAHAFLESMGFQEVRWREYERLAHWYSEDMLKNIVDFLVERWGFKVSES